jgi:hypothetical protein
MYLGHLDLLNEGEVAGWIVNLFDPNDRPVIEVLCDGEVIASAQVHLPRPDLDLGENDALAGFHIPVGGLVSEGQTITVRTDNAQFDFNEASYEAATVQRWTRIRPVERFEFPKVLYRAEDPRLINYNRMVDIAHLAAREGRPIFIVPPFVDWNMPLFQRPQHICVALARLGVQVIFFSPSFAHDDGEGVLALQDNLILCREACFERFVADAPACFIDVYSTAWVYNTDKIASWSQHGHQIVYEYVDHIDEEISGADGAQECMKTFRSLNSELVSIVVPTATILHEEVRLRFADEMIAFSPNGVEVERFEDEKETHPLIEEIKEKHPGRPVIGYVGALARWIDFEMIEELAQMRPDLLFVFVGPIYDARVKPAEAENIIYTGPLPYPNVPRVLNSFDVAWIPFRAGDIAQTTSPLKLFEYFAARKPVVVNSDMRECTAFDEVLHGSDAETMADAVDRALSLRNDEEFSEQLSAHAHAASWEERAKVLLEAMKTAPDRALSFAQRSGIPHKFWKMRSGTLSPNPQEAQHRLTFREGLGVELSSRSHRGNVGDYALAALDTDQLDIPMGVPWHLRIVLLSSAPPPVMMIMIDVMIDGEVQSSFDAAELHTAIELLLDGSSVVGKTVELRFRTLRSHARQYLDHLSVIFKDVSVLDRALSKSFINSSWKTYQGTSK